MHVMYSEESIKNRLKIKRKNTAGAIQLERMYVITKDTLRIDHKARNHYEGTSCGALGLALAINESMLLWCQSTRHSIESRRGTVQMFVSRSVQHFAPAATHPISLVYPLATLPRLDLEGLEVDSCVSPTRRLLFSPRCTCNFRRLVGGVGVGVGCAGECNCANRVACGSCARELWAK